MKFLWNQKILPLSQINWSKTSTITCRRHSNQQDLIQKVLRMKKKLPKWCQLPIRQIAWRRQRNSMICQMKVQDWHWLTSPCHHPTRTRKILVCLWTNRLVFIAATLIWMFWGISYQKYTVSWVPLRVSARIVIYMLRPPCHQLLMRKQRSNQIGRNLHPWNSSRQRLWMNKLSFKLSHYSLRIQQLNRNKRIWNKQFWQLKKLTPLSHRTFLKSLSKNVRMRR